MATIATPGTTRHRLTVADFHRMADVGIFQEDDRVELIEGEIIDMAPIGSGHTGTVMALNRLLARALGDSAIVLVQSPVVLPEHSEPEPDLALLRPREDFYRSGHPLRGDILLIIEVADTRLAYDRDVKMPLYARHGYPGGVARRSRRQAFTRLHLTLGIGLPRMPHTRSTKNARAC